VQIYRFSWRRLSAIIAMYALALNIVGAFCGCATQAADGWAPIICTHNDAYQTSNKGHIHGQQDDDGLCCKCCGTIALNTVNVPPSLPLPVRIEWRNNPRIFVADHVVPKSRRHIIESPRGPPLA
jgi:hypothetical protein